MQMILKENGIHSILSMSRLRDKVRLIVLKLQLWLKWKSPSNQMEILTWLGLWKTIRKSQNPWLISKLMKSLRIIWPQLVNWLRIFKQVFVSKWRQCTLPRQERLFSQQDMKRLVRWKRTSINWLRSLKQSDSVKNEGFSYCVDLFV